jgi:hypothetical protein
VCGRVEDRCRAACRPPWSDLAGRERAVDAGRRQAGARQPASELDWLRGGAQLNSTDVSSVAMEVTVGAPATT